MGRRVWFHEIAEFILGKRLKSSTLTLRRFWGASLEEHEESMVKRKRSVIPIEAVQAVQAGQTGQTRRKEQQLT